MHRPTLAALLLLLASCAPGDRETAAAGANLAAPGSVPAQAPESGTFRILKGDSTVVTVRFQRTAEQLASELSAGADDERMTYTAALNPDATVSGLQAQIFAPGAAQPNGRIDLALRGDSAHIDWTEDGKAQKASARVPVGVIPIAVGEAVAMAEQILRRARVLGGTTVRVPILPLEGGAELGMATVTFMGTDSARVRFSSGGRDAGEGNELIAATDAVGRLLGGRLPEQGYVIRRDR